MQPNLMVTLTGSQINALVDHIQAIISPVTRYQKDQLTMAHEVIEQNRTHARAMMTMLQNVVTPGSEE
jgi:hypothetical protein